MLMQQIVFAIVAAIALAYAAWQFIELRKKILLGKEEVINGQAAQRWRNVLLVAFGQKKMFQRWGPAIFHFFIYAAFLLTQIELIEIFIDGLTGQHRFFYPLLGGGYVFVINFIEVLSVLALLATIVFLIRRNIIRTPRLQQAEMKGWPSRDGNLILVLEIFLIFFIFLMNSADMALHDNAYGFLVSQHLSGLWSEMSTSSLHILERTGWWGHLLVVFAFLNYLPVSKHLHILLAFPNTYFASLKPRGEMDNMPAIMQEVKSMMGLEATTESEGELEEELPEFGANDILGLSWKRLMDAYSCTECGRCTSVCPANITGKQLSPRKIMMDIRDRTDEVYTKLKSGDTQYAANPELPLGKSNFSDGKSLFDSITREEIHACTTCNACVEACPVLINPLDAILELRRYEILTESAGPADWLPMFNSIENTGAVWSMPGTRTDWMNQL